jgi:hypothetical protein
MTVIRPVVPAICAAVFAACVLCACGDDGNGAGPDAMRADAAISPACLEAENHADLEWLQDNVFTPSCAAFAACHQGAANAARGLNLELGNTEGNLLGVESVGFPGEILVVPGDPGSSYLMVAVGSYPGELSNFGTMPPNNPVLCIQKRQAIERWIAGLPVP